MFGALLSKFKYGRHSVSSYSDQMFPSIIPTMGLVVNLMKLESLCCMTEFQTINDSSLISPLFENNSTEELANSLQLLLSYALV